MGGRVADDPPRHLPQSHPTAQIGRMLASYQQYSDDQLMDSYKQFSTVLKAFLTGK